MKLYIYHDFGRIGVTPDALSSCVHDFPSQFLMALCRGEVAYYSGTLRALRLFLDNPRIYDILLKGKSDSGSAAVRLEYLRVFVSALEDM